MKSLSCTHLVWWPNCGLFYGVVIGRYMRIFTRSFTTNTLELRNWQRVPTWVAGLEITPLPVNEQRIICEDEPRAYICAQDGL